MWPASSSPSVHRAPALPSIASGRGTLVRTTFVAGLALGVPVGCAESHPLPADASVLDAGPADAGADTERVLDVLASVHEGVCDRQTRCGLWSPLYEQSACEPFDREGARRYASRARIDEAALERCLAELASACDAELVSVELGARSRGLPPASCDEVTYTYLPGSCWRDGCGEGFACRGRVDCAGSECVEARPVGTFGDACAWPDLVCGPDLECASSGTCVECTGDHQCSPDHFCDRASGRCAPDRSEGAPCSSASQCVSPLVCTTLGACGPLGTLGVACSSTARCAPGLHCADGACRAYPGLDEPCSDLIGCAEGLRCAGGGTCAPQIEVGAPCIGTALDACLRPDLRCEGGVCRLAREGDTCWEDEMCSAPAAYCEVITGVCVRDPVGRDCFDGTPCEGATLCNGFRCYVPRRPGERCGSYYLCEGGRCVDEVCVDVVSPEDPCGESALCPYGWRCVAGSCVAYPALGAACTDVCFRGLCLDGVCRVLEPGEPCSTHEQCELGCDPETATCARVQTVEGGRCGGDGFGWQCAEPFVCHPHRDDDGVLRSRCLAVCG